MKKVKWTLFIAMAAMLGMAAGSARASMNITEWMYNGLTDSGNEGEFVQFTNTGATPVNMNGWSFDDNSRTPGSQDLSAFGTVAPGQSVIFTDDDTAAEFQSDWNLDSSVEIIPGNMNNLGRSDEINLYDNTNTLVDRLTYNDQGTGTVKGPRTNSVSGYILPANYGANNASLAVIAAVGDGFGSRASTLGEIGNPGPVAAPEPASLGLLAVAGLFVRRNRRGRA